MLLEESMCLKSQWNVIYSIFKQFQVAQNKNKGLFQEGLKSLWDQI